MKAKLTLEDGRTIDIELTPEQEKAMEVKKVGRWKPSEWENYYFPKASNVVAPEEYAWRNDDADNNFYKHWLIFKTEEEAQFYLDKQEFITKVNDRIDELNDGWTPDWNSNLSIKYLIVSLSNAFHKEIQVENTVSIKFQNILNYMKSRQIAEQIISEFKDDLLKYIFN